MKYLRGVVPIVLIGAWLWLWIGGCEQPICRVLGVYTHRVDRLPEYVEYVAGADLFKERRAWALVFSCDALRDQLVERVHKSMVADAPLGVGNRLREEVVRLGLLGARREGKTLHMMNDVTVGPERLDDWAAEMRRLVQTEPQDKREHWLPGVLRRLFGTIVLHAGEKQVMISLVERRGNRCD